MVILTISKSNLYTFRRSKYCESTFLHGHQIWFVEKLQHVHGFLNSRIGIFENAKNLSSDKKLMINTKTFALFIININLYKADNS